MTTLEQWIGLYYTLSEARRAAIAEGTPSAPKAKAKAVAKPVQKKVTKGKKPTIEKLESYEDNVLFASLKSWRTQVAKDLGQAPYMVFSDKSLINISHYRPTTLDELLAMYGMGKISWKSMVRLSYK